VNGIGACRTEDTELLGTCGTGAMLADGGMFEALGWTSWVGAGKWTDLN